MTQSAIPAAIAAKEAEDMRAAIVGELIPTIPANVDPQTWDPRELGALGGNIWPAVCWQERFWFRDPDDATTDHDEITCIVTLDGSRYKTNDVRFPEYVLSRTIDTPPVSGAEYGDTYLVPEGATGEWATKENQLAIWTARGWKYRPPSIGELVYVADPLDLGFIHVNDQGEWEDGVGPRNLLDGSVLPRHLLIRSWQVENQTTTTPPASGPAGGQYIIGSSATGSWSGHDKKIAWRPATDAEFVITAPFIGEMAFDKSLGIPVRWNGTSWESAAGALIFRNRIFTAASTGFTLNAGAGFYVYSPTSPPVTGAASHTNADDGSTITHAAKKIGNKLQFQYQAAMALNSGSGFSAIGLFRDNETIALDWALGVSATGYVSRMLETEAADTASHVYKIRWFYADTSNATITRRSLEIREYV